MGGEITLESKAIKRARPPPPIIPEVAGFALFSGMS
jgi:hypothetical protein